VAEALTYSVPVYTVEAYGEWGETIEANPDVMFHQILKRFRTGRDFDGPTYARIWMRLDALRASFRSAVARLRRRADADDAEPAAERRPPA
jgi:aspartyl-tRNA(Asn)/glutamyl-tRNA(Gln) amidotransferase subunit A